MLLKQITKLSEDLRKEKKLKEIADALDKQKLAKAAEAMKISAQDLLELGVVDGVIQEPIGGAHRDVSLAVERLGDAVEAAIQDLEALSPEELRKQRREKFLAIGRNGLA